jgi:hypothetical protein
LVAADKFFVPSIQLTCTGLTRTASQGYGRGMENKKPSRQQVYTLVVQIGRKDGDGLPDGATGAALMIYASGVDEAEAVRETVAILKQADTAPLDVTGYGTLAEREAEGHEIEDPERELMQRALDENAVIVAQMTPFFGDEQSTDLH